MFGLKERYGMLVCTTLYMHVLYVCMISLFFVFPFYISSL